MMDLYAPALEACKNTWRSRPDRLEQKNMETVQGATVDRLKNRLFDLIVANPPNFDNMNLICRLIDGRYPNYEAVIPLDNPNKMTIDRLSFLNAIRRVSIFSNKTTHQVKIRIAGSQLDISAEDVDFGNDANERLACSYEGKDMEIAFNARFLMDMLNNLAAEHVVMELSLPNRAGLLSPPKDESDPNEDLLMLVMPVMLN
jgi:DNA polymerase-3 subunit beta